MDGRIDNSINQGRGRYKFKLVGQNYYIFGILLQTDGNPVRFQ